MTARRLLGISGSLRRDSNNTAILRTLVERHGQRDVTIDLFPLNDVPLYDQDADGDTPPAAVAALRAAIDAADGLIIASPEYNHGMSGVLKNALDWASRPHGRSVLTGKPVLTLTSSPAFTGGVRAQAQLDELLIAVQARLVPRPQIVIGLVRDRIRDGRIADETTLGFLRQGVEDLVGALRGTAV